MPPQAAEKARGACRPGRDELSIGKLQRRLCRLKKRRSRKKSREATKVVAAATESAAEGGAKAAKRQKDLILFVRSRHCGELNRGLQNLDSFFEKGFNFVSAKLWFCALIRGLQNLELPARERFYSFRLYEKNGEYPRGLRTSGLRGRFKSPLDTWLFLK